MRNKSCSTVNEHGRIGMIISKGFTEALGIYLELNDTREYI